MHCLRDLNVQVSNYKHAHKVVDVKVSQRIGNSLCSQPALLMSAFGMLICECVDKDRESKSVEESQRDVEESRATAAQGYETST